MTRKHGKVNEISNLRKSKIDFSRDISYPRREMNFSKMGAKPGTGRVNFLKSINPFELLGSQSLTPNLLPASIKTRALLTSGRSLSSGSLNFI